MKRILAAAVVLILIGLLITVVRPAFRRPPSEPAPAAAEDADDAGVPDSDLSLAPAGAPAITVDYPEEGSIFPPEIAPPTFLWHDGSPAAVAWRVDVEFSDAWPAVHLRVRGAPPHVGEIDARCIADTNELPKLTPEETSARSWTPDAEIWERVKKHSTAGPATVMFTGLTAAQPPQAVSQGRVALQTSRDPVAAPIFYRDVPLMPAKLEKGIIQPIIKNAQPLIGWRLRDVAQPRSRLLLENLSTCANCHSFSRDGKTLAMDLDGPLNDKGAYVIAPVEPQMSIRNEHVMTWTSYPDKPPGHKTTGFMSQISPDGRFVLSTLNEALYVVNFTDYRFLQVFYPTRGILACYDRQTGRIHALPGADDPRYVQTGPVWTPDGKDVVFLRAEAKDPYPQDGKLAAYAGDPAETKIQYDLYRIPFNGGRGGRAEPIRGGAGNGRSNSFAKVSPDGRWIVFVQCRNGLLMRPDSLLYILPIEGGTPRLMRCNTARMNSWHSFAPNGRWMVFSSKSRSPYTQMFLTHLDEEGHDSPAILIPNATAANRAVNIPEFINIKPEGLLKIDVPAAEVYRLLDLGRELELKGGDEAAIDAFQKALAIDPRFDKAHYELGVVLAKRGQVNEAIDHYRQALSSAPRDAASHSNFGLLLAGRGQLDEAIAHFRASVEADPAHSGYQGNLAVALESRGDREEAMVHYRKAVELGGGESAHYNLGCALVRRRRFDDAITEYQAALVVNPNSATTHNNLGNALFSLGRIAEAIPHFERALQLRPDYPLARRNLEKARAAAAHRDAPVPDGPSP